MSGLSTPHDFLRNVVDVDVADFTRSGQTELRLAFHACTSLLSLRDWVAEAHSGKIWTWRTDTRAPISKRALLAALISIEGDFGVISDVANASKHMVLKPDRRQTELRGASDVGSQVLFSGTFAGAPLGVMPFCGGTISRVRVQIGSEFHDVLDAVTKVQKVWHEAFEENGW